MDQLTSLESVIAAIASVKDENARHAMVKKYMDGIPDPETATGKGVMHRRALLMTELRKRDLWPPKL